MQNTEKHVYVAIAEVIGKLAKEGITKNRKNQQQGYNFRGIDDVYNALAPMLAESKLNVLPRYTERALVERVSAKGGALFYVTVTGEFDFVSAVDGSKHTVGPFYGEAMDSGDKATNKAMSAAYKYACMQAFCIPTEGDNDADSHTHEVEAKTDFADPRGDLGKNVPEKIAIDAATQMLAVLEADVDEDVKALHVYDLHQVLARDSNVYVAASDQMNAKMRSAWKTYIKQAKEQANRPLANGRAGHG